MPARFGLLLVASLSKPVEILESRLLADRRWHIVEITLSVVVGVSVALLHCVEIYNVSIDASLHSFSLKTYLSLSLSTDIPSL